MNFYLDKKMSWFKKLYSLEETKVVYKKSKSENKDEVKRKILKNRRH